MLKRSDWERHYSHKWRSDKDNAIRVAVKMSEEHGVEFRAFKCKVCMMWHVGKIEPILIREEVDGNE
ncbi:MAG: hypothetical protein MUO73_06995 [Thermoplasmata archaeon]|nr:hypothetical protein [Thermoplasmata archaeon]